MRIAHISDVHIRKTRRHKEYAEVLDNLCNSIESLSVDRIVLAGDLLHNKTDLSPEVFDLASEYLDKLSDLAPIDMILGNHDCVINQQDRQDSISPIVKLLSRLNKPIYLFLESGIIFHTKMDEKNRHWRGIIALVDAGEITIAVFDPDNP